MDAESNAHAMPSVLPLKKMSRTEKLIAMEALWVDLSADDSQFASPAWHGDVLKETQQLVRAGKAKFSDWEEAKVRVRRKASRMS